MNTIDRDGPPDGDFARYVERLTGNAGRTPGRVESAASARRAAGAATTGGAATASDTNETGAPPRPTAGTPGERLAEALRMTHPGARGKAGKAVDAEALRAAGRAVGARLSRWLMVGGAALIVLAVFELVPGLSPLPGFALLLLSFFLRRLAAR